MSMLSATLSHSTLQHLTLSLLVASSILFSLELTYLYLSFPAMTDIQTSSVLGFLHQPWYKPNLIRSLSRDQPPATGHSNSTNPDVSKTRLPYLENMTICTCETPLRNHIDKFTYPNQHLEKLHWSLCQWIQSLSSDLSRATPFCSWPVIHTININVNQSPPTTWTTLHKP